MTLSEYMIHGIEKQLLLFKKPLKAYFRYFIVLYKKPVPFIKQFSL